MSVIILMLFCCSVNGYTTPEHGCENDTLPDPETSCCGVQVSNTKFLVDVHAQIYEYPWLAIIEYRKGKKVKTLCGGGLISSRYILTAAHCVTQPLINIAMPTHIRLGEYDTSHDGPDCVPMEAGTVDCTEGVTKIPIHKIMTHPLYQPRDILQKHDVALVRMRQNAPFTDYIRPICLPTSSTRLDQDNIQFIMAGWATSSKSSPYKQQVDLPLVPRQICQEQYSILLNVTIGKGQFCAGSQKCKDSCENDSGMPLMFQNSKGQFEVVGLVSFGPTPCGLANVPTIYTNIYEYLSWISIHVTPLV